MIYVHHMCNMLHVCIYAQTIPNKSQDQAQTIQTLVINVCIPNQGHKSQMRKQIADLRGDFAYTKNSCNIVCAQHPFLGICHRQHLWRKVNHLEKILLILLVRRQDDFLMAKSPQKWEIHVKYTLYTFQWESCAFWLKSCIFGEIVLSCGKKFNIIWPVEK